MVRMTVPPFPRLRDCAVSAIALAGLCIALAGCSTMMVPAQLAGNDFSQVTPHQAQTRPDVLGFKVRWGGTIARTTPDGKQTCFEVVSRPLDDSARPEQNDRTDGRFIACLNGFFDPEVYAVKREITVTGTLQLPTIGKIGQADYIFPHVAIDTLYLWPKAVPYDPNADFGPDPFMYQNPWMMGPMGPMGPMEPWGLGW